MTGIIGVTKDALEGKILLKSSQLKRSCASVNALARRQPSNAPYSTSLCSILDLLLCFQLSAALSSSPSPVTLATARRSHRTLPLHRTSGRFPFAALSSRRPVIRCSTPGCGQASSRAPLRRDWPQLPAIAYSQPILTRSLPSPPTAHPWLP